MIADWLRENFSAWPPSSAVNDYVLPVTHNVPSPATAQMTIEEIKRRSCCDPRDIVRSWVDDPLVPGQKMFAFKIKPFQYRDFPAMDQAEELHTVEG